MEDPKFSQQVLQIAALGIWQVVTGRPMAKPLIPVPDDRWKKKTGVFVTLKTGMHIRGSVGLLESSTSLQESLFDAGQSAATHDHRFKPVDEEEIENISLEVTIIEDVRKLENKDDLAVGKHGIIVTKAEKRGILLPQVAEEQSWSAEQFLEATCEKAGLPHEAWKDPNTLVESFTSEFYSAPSMYELIKEFVS